MSVDDDITRQLADLRAGRLSATEAAELEARLAGDPALAAWQRLDGAIADSFDAPSPGAFGWARLAREIEAQPVARRFSGWHLAATAAAAALAAVLAWQVIVPSADAPDGFVTASGETGAADLRVSFVPQTTEAEMRAALAAIGARIVDGPGALGLYALDLPEGSDSAAAAETLRAARGVVESVSLP